jgi:hypothetical protein
MSSTVNQPFLIFLQDMSNRELEFFCSVILIIYGINFWYGKRENQMIAYEWLGLVKQVLADNFSKIGSNNAVKGIKDVVFE